MYIKIDFKCNNILTGDVMESGIKRVRIENLYQIQLTMFFFQMKINEEGYLQYSIQTVNNHEIISVIVNSEHLVLYLHILMIMIDQIVIRS